MRARPVVLCLALAVLTAALYAPTAGNGFVNLDDDRYIYENPQVRRGLGWGTALWALTSRGQANWYPLTWLSHMLDARLFGLDARGPHLTASCSMRSAPRCSSLRSCD